MKISQNKFKFLGQVIFFGKTLNEMQIFRDVGSILVLFLVFETGRNVSYLLLQINITVDCVSWGS